jgi:hypothetical protein
MKKSLTLALALIALAVLSGFGLAQEARQAQGLEARQVQGPPLPCPNSRHVTLQATTPSANMADFPTKCSAGFEQNLNGSTPDRCYIHTFNVPMPSEFCCQCVESQKNSLTIRYSALVPGPVGSSSSYNDTVAIYPGGLSVTRLYPLGSPVTLGQTGTKTIPLTCAMLKNNPLRLSILGQDDTKFTSATLELDLCCVRK